MYKKSSESPADPGSTSLFFAKPMTVEELAAHQGVQPIQSIDDLYGDFWPESDTIEEFVATIRKWRQEGG
jgi:hypothetical protein